MVARFVSYFGRALAVFFVGKYFVVRLSTTKTTKILPPRKIPAITVLFHLFEFAEVSLGLQTEAADGDPDDEDDDDRPPAHGQYSSKRGSITVT